MNIECIKKFNCKFQARLFENSCIISNPKEICLNHMCAYSYNYSKTRDNEKKKRSRRDYYNRKKLDPIWMENERNRNKIRMRNKRAKLKQLRNS